MESGEELKERLKKLERTLKFVQSKKRKLEIENIRLEERCKVGREYSERFVSQLLSHQTNLTISQHRSCSQDKYNIPQHSNCMEVKSTKKRKIEESQEDKSDLPFLHSPQPTADHVVQLKPLSEDAVDEEKDICNTHAEGSEAELFQDAGKDDKESSLLKERDDLQAQVDSLETELAGKREKIVALEEKVMAMEEAKEKISNESEAMIKKIKCAGRQYKAKHAQAESHVKNLKQEIGQLSEKIDASEAELDRAKASSEAQSNELRLVSEDMARIITEYEALKKSKVNEISSENGSLKEQIETLKKVNDDKTKNLLESEDVILRQKKELESLSVRLTEAEANLAMATSAVEAKTAEISTASSDVKTILINYEAMKKSNEELELRQNYLTAEVTALRKKLRSQMEMEQRKKEELEKNKILIKSLTVTSNSLRARHRKAESEVSRLKAKVNKLLSGQERESTASNAKGDNEKQQKSLAARTVQTPDVIIVDAEDGAKEVVVGGVAAVMVSIGTQTLVDVDEQGHCQIPPQFVVEDQEQNQELEAAELKIKELERLCMQYRSSQPKLMLDPSTQQLIAKRFEAFDQGDSSDCTKFPGRRAKAGKDPCVKHVCTIKSPGDESDMECSEESCGEEVSNDGLPAETDYIEVHHHDKVNTTTKEICVQGKKSSGNVNRANDSKHADHDKIDDSEMKADISKVLEQADDPAESSEDSVLNSSDLSQTTLKNSCARHCPDISPSSDAPRPALKEQARRPDANPPALRVPGVRTASSETILILQEKKKTIKNLRILGRNFKHKYEMANEELKELKDEVDSLKNKIKTMEATIRESVGTDGLSQQLDEVMNNTPEEDRARGVLVSAKRVIIRLRQELTDLTARHDQSLVDLAAKEALIKKLKEEILILNGEQSIESDYISGRNENQVIQLRHENERLADKCRVKAEQQLSEPLGKPSSNTRAK